MIDIYDYRAKKARHWAKGLCGYGCGRPIVLDCGICRECADKNAAAKRRWKARQKANLSKS